MDHPRGCRRPRRRTQPWSVSPQAQPGDRDHHAQRQYQDRRSADRGRAPTRSRTPRCLGADSPEQVDVTDLGRLLYASLVCRWPGGPAFGLPNAPMVGRRWMSPRQVRAGVSPALDNVCDQILGDPPRHHARADHYSWWHRHSTDEGARQRGCRAGSGTPPAAADTQRGRKAPNRSMQQPSATPVSSLLDQTTARQRAIRTRTIPAASAPPTTGRPGCERVDDPAGPPTATRPAQTRPPSQPSGTQQRRRWIGLLLVLAVLLIAAGIISALILDRRISSAPEPQTSRDQQSTAAQPSPAQPSKLTIANARDFDPQGDDQDGES